jgi:phosphoribosylglycinamide formyltransferase-1
MNNIVIFASGSGSNAENIVKYFRNSPRDRVVALFCNRPGALVLERARRLAIPTVLFNKEEFIGGGLLEKLRAFDAAAIILAGFLWKIPGAILDAFPGRIINIHPALLPAHGGKGMYGMHVHEAVIAAGDPVSGITVHRVNEHYDAGENLFQATCPVDPGDTPDRLAEKIHALEQAHFPRVIEEFLATLPPFVRDTLI